MKKGRTIIFLTESVFWGPIYSKSKKKGEKNWQLFFDPTSHTDYNGHISGNKDRVGSIKEPLDRAHPDALPDNKR
jgi:hypothetical protein